MTMTALTRPAYQNKPAIFLDVSNSTLLANAEQFRQLCKDNPDLRLELSRDGELHIMAPAGGDSSNKNMTLSSVVWIWNEASQLGLSFDSSVGFDLTGFGGGIMSPDVSWVEKSRLVGIDTSGFIPIVPDFVIELRSESDSLKVLQKKMGEYQRLGVRLGILINPKNKQAEVYRPNQPVIMLESPQSIDCTDVMPGFVLNLSRMW